MLISFKREFKSDVLERKKVAKLKTLILKMRMNMVKDIVKHIVTSPILYIKNVLFHYTSSAKRGPPLLNILSKRVANI